MSDAQMTISRLIQGARQELAEMQSAAKAWQDRVERQEQALAELEFIQSVLTSAERGGEQMTDAPDKIALRWETGAAVTNGPLMTHPDYTPFVRADLCADPALLAEAVEVLRKLSEAVAMECDFDKHSATFIRRYINAHAFIAKWENLHDR